MLGRVCKNGSVVCAGTLERGGPRPRGAQPPSEADLARGALSPRARRTSPEVAFSPRARRTSPQVAFGRAALAGRGGHQGCEHLVRAFLGS
jgi:hypothetical protein